MITIKNAFPSFYLDGNRKLNLFLSFAVGGLLGDVFLHLLPEAFVHFKPGTIVSPCTVQQCYLQ